MTAGDARQLRAALVAGWSLATPEAYAPFAEATPVPVTGEAAAPRPGDAPADRAGRVVELRP